MTSSREVARSFGEGYQDPERSSEELLDERISGIVDLEQLVPVYEKFFDYAATTEGVKSILQALARLLVRLSPRMDEYRRIVSDDTSARLLSIFLQETMRIKQGEKKRIPIAFVYGSRFSTDLDVVRDHLKSQVVKGEKALLVTEYIDTGRTAMELSGCLHALGVPHDLAVVSLRKQVKFYQRIDAPIIYGSIGDEGLAFWSRQDTGVVRGTDRELLSRRKVYGDTKQIKINQARSAARTLARDLSPVLSLVEP